MYQILSRREELADQYFPDYDENGNEIPDQGTTLTNRTVITTVEYEFGDDKVILEIPHFNPQTEDDILLGISNREISEKRNRGIE